MALSFDDFTSVLKSQLTPGERAACLAYAVDHPLAKGQRLDLPGLALEVPWEAFLAFVDRDPLANWGHPARYLLVSRGNDEPRSFETRLPPFGGGSALSWRMVYQAPSVPDAAVAIPRHDTLHD
jgi:hypothetical protein